MCIKSSLTLTQTQGASFCLLTFQKYKNSSFCDPITLQFIHLFSFFSSGKSPIEIYQATIFNSKVMTALGCRYSCSIWNHFGFGDCVYVWESLSEVHSVCYTFYPFIIVFYVYFVPRIYQSISCLFIKRQLKRYETKQNYSF